MSASSVRSGRFQNPHRQLIFSGRGVEANKAFVGKISETISVLEDYMRVSEFRHEIAISIIRDVYAEIRELLRDSVPNPDLLRVYIPNERRMVEDSTMPRANDLGLDAPGDVHTLASDMDLCAAYARPNDRDSVELVMYALRNILRGYCVNLQADLGRGAGVSRPRRSRDGTLWRWVQNGKELSDRQRRRVGAVLERVAHADFQTGTFTLGLAG